MTEALLYPRNAVAATDRNASFDALRAPMTRFTKIFAFAVIFVSAWYLCLPETEAEVVTLPWWAIKHKPGNVTIYEALFAAYLGLGGIGAVWLAATRARYLTFPVSACLVLLAIWTAVASLLAPFPMHDAGRSARLIMMAALVMAVTHWSAKDPLFVLRTFMLGLVGSSIVNLVMTFQNPIIMVAGMLPRLLGQNSPGPPMGIAVSLAAWLILVSRRPRDTVFAIIVATVCSVGAMISYSKTGMMAAVIGLGSILIVSGRVAPTRRGRLLVTLLLMLILAGAYWARGEAGQRAMNALSIMVKEKVESAQPGESVSMNERWSYVMGVSEIVAKNPLGVGYSGFRGAMLKTAAFRSGHAADEASIPAEDSNPHSLFLYYLSAGGLVGGGLGIAVFILLCSAFVRGLGIYGWSGTLVGLLIAASFLILALSVGYLFNSGVMLIPAAIAAGMHAHVKGPARLAR
jgi:hypothetical protein